MGEDQVGNVTTAATKATTTSTQEVGVKTGWQKPRPPVPEPEPILQKEVVDERQMLDVNIGPFKEITKDTHTRLAQYLGIVNPGVLRVMADMLREQETKVVNFLAGAGVKLG